MPVKGLVVLKVQVGELDGVSDSMSPPAYLSPEYWAATSSIHIFREYSRVSSELISAKAARYPIWAKFDAFRGTLVEATVSKASNKVRISKSIVVPPRSEAHVEVVSAVAGLFLPTGD